MRSDWEPRLRQRLQNASAIFERNFRIRWQVADVVGWNSSQAVRDIDALRMELQAQVGLDTAEVVLGYTGETESGRLASTVPFLPTLLVRDEPGRTERQSVLILVHELAHLFGAWHSPSKQSVMYEVPESERFDEDSRQVIALMRSFNFQRGIDALDRKTAAALMSLMRKAPDARGSPLASAYTDYGVLLLQKREAEAAILQFRRALGIEPNYAPAHFNLGVALKDRGLIEAAIGEFRDAVKLEPQYAEAHENLGIALVLQGKIDEGIEHIREAVRLNPEQPSTHYNLGVALVRQLGQIDAAVAALQSAVRLKPDYGDAQRSLRLTLETRKQLQDHVQRYKGLVRSRPNDANARYNLGVSLARQGNFESALREFQEAVRIDPGHGNAHMNLALVLFSLRKYDEAWVQARVAQQSGAHLNSEFQAALESKRTKAP